MTSKPWFGPTRRARELLAARTDVAEPTEALVTLQDVMGERFGLVQHVRFVDFRKRPQNFRFTIALMWVGDDPATRDLLYTLGADVVERTGWYPLVQGSRLGSGAQHARTLSKSRGSLPSITGRMVSFEAAVVPSDGCSVRVHFTGGDSLLLDSGLPGRLDVLPSDRLLLVTHSHMDHSGGLVSGRAKELPFVTSTATAQILSQHGHLGRDEHARHGVLVDPGTRVQLGPSLELEAFSVPHSPGSVGYILRSGGHTLMFTGDAGLATARYDWVPELLARVAAESDPVTLLLDATMAGRRAGASMADPAGRALRESEETDLVVLGDSGDHLLYAYLDMFHSVQRSARRHTRSFVVSERVRPLATAVHSAFIRRELESTDQVLAGQYGRSMPAWGESRWLYWSDRLRARPEGPTIWFTTPNEADRIPAGPGTATVYVGRSETPPVPAGRSWRLLDLDTSPWTAHTSQDVLVDTVRRLDTQGCRVVLFHNFPKRLQKFVNTNGLAAEPLSGQVRLGGVPGGN